MKYFKIICITTALIISNSANASSLSANGYSLNSTSNIVSDGSTEWLRWDETIGMSINDALSAYSSQGWRVASNQEMASLFNSFAFDPYNPNYFDADENTTNSRFPAYDASEDLATNHFISLFGYTRVGVGANYDPSEPLYQSNVYFGQDLDNDGFYNQAFVRDDWISTDWGNEPGYAAITQDYSNITADTFSSEFGIALVRGGEISAVPVPAAFWLFGSGLLGLIGFSRRRK